MSVVINTSRPHSMTFISEVFAEPVLVGHHKISVGVKFQVNSEIRTVEISEISQHHHDGCAWCRLKMSDGISGPMKSLSGGAPPHVGPHRVCVDCNFGSPNMDFLMKYGLFQFLKSRCMMMATTPHTVEPRWDLRKVLTGWHHDWMTDGHTESVLIGHRKYLWVWSSRWQCEMGWCDWVPWKSGSKIRVSQDHQICSNSDFWYWISKYTWLRTDVQPATQTRPTIKTDRTRAASRCLISHRSDTLVPARAQVQTSAKKTN